MPTRRQGPQHAGPHVPLPRVAMLRACLTCLPAWAGHATTHLGAPEGPEYREKGNRRFGMSQTQAPVGVPASDFDLDIAIVDGGGEVDMLPMSTDNGCSSTCPNACSGSGVRQMC